MARAFWLRWTLSNTLAGLGGALVGITVFVVTLRTITSLTLERNSPVFTVAFLLMHFLPAASFALVVAGMQRRLLRREMVLGWGWTFVSAIGAGIGALIGVGLVSIRALSAVFAGQTFIASLSLGIGLGIGFAQWLYLRRHAPQAWQILFAYPAGLLVGALVIPNLLASIIKRSEVHLTILAAVGALSWAMTSAVTGLVIARIIPRSDVSASVS